MSAATEATPKEAPVEKEIIGLTKMSVNTICGKRSMGKICVILGKATGANQGEDANGHVWSALLGTFQGTNLQTGETFRSGKLFLPSGIHEPIEAAVGQLKEGGSVNFAIEFRRVEAENPIGYSYQAVNLLPVETQEDALGDLLSAVHGKMTQLLAGTKPAQIEAPQPAPAAAPAKKK
jgi:hypothetical protein